MIQITKDEACLLRQLYPEYKITRTMVQDSKRHHYYATEAEVVMRAIASTNQEAADKVEQIDRARRLNRQRWQNREVG